jgi:ferredoxin
MPKNDEERAVRVTVQTDHCMGHARCAAVAPEVYELNDEGYNATPEQVVEPARASQALRGARACPERIIKVEDA